MGYVNKGIAKIDGMDIALGKPVYTDDICTGALVVKILRSPHAYAKIRSIDVEKAKALSGVECVLTHEDVPKSKFTLAGQSYPEPSPYDRRILDEYVRYVGDEVAIVAAKDERTADRALGLIKVEYEVLEPVLDFETAEESSSKVHVDEPYVSFDIGLRNHKNLAAGATMGYGDIEDELEKSDVVVEGTYYMQAQAHAMMETYRTWTHFDHMGRLNVVSSTQIPFHVRRILARALEIPASKIRVVKPRIGGGFGGKQTASVEIFPAIVTLKTGKPAKIIYSRKESFSCTTSRHAMKIHVRLGADKDGKINAVDMEALSDTGAYGEHCWTVFTVAGHKSLPLYNKAKAARYHGKVVYTNKMPAGALRGYGVTQGTFAIESAVNELAKKLDMDPAVIRENNLIKQGEKSPMLAGGDEKNPVTLASSSLDRCIVKGKKLIGWDEKYPCTKVSNGKARGVGMAVTMQGSGIAGIDTASVMIKLNSEGFYTLMIGSTDMGTGCDTILAQMAAQVLDTDMENITVYAADTDVSPYDTGSYASSTTYVTGNATIFAARDLRSKMVEKVADMWNVSVEDVDFDGSEMTSKCGKKMSLAKFANTLAIGEGNLQLVGNGTFGGDTSPPPFIAGFAEVEVDMETGKVDLVDYVAVVDCGTVINPNLARIQVEGGIVQGIGIALYEDVQYSQTGRMITDTFMQYKIPCRKDINSLRVEFEPSYEPTGPFGAKSVGEVVINTPAPAIADAVSNAVGKRFRKLPITPDKVLKKIME